MILYSNLEQIRVNNNLFITIPVLKLSSSQLSGLIDSSQNSREDIIDFANSNNLSSEQIKIMKTLFVEANTNNFVVKIGGISQ